MKVQRWHSEVNVLMDAVIITGDNEAEVQAESERLGEEAGEAHFLNPTYNKMLKQWVMVGEVRRLSH